MRGYLVSLSLVVAACGAPPPAPLADGGISIFAPATDDPRAFVPIRDGAEVELVQGAQGGFHVWMKFRVKGSPAELTLLRTARRLADDKLVLRMEAQPPPGVMRPDGVWEVDAALPMFMCPSPIGLSVIDRSIVFQLALTDAAGNTAASGAVTLVPRCPADAVAFCQKICTG